MSFTYDLTTDRGKVRLVIDDKDDVVVANQFYTDDEIDAFITLSADEDGETIRLASALALETLASNQVMVLKVIQRLDLQTDGAAVAKEMRERAAGLREAAANSSDYAGFEIAEFALGPFSVREQVVSKALRDD